MKQIDVAESIISQIARFMRPTWSPPGANRAQVGPMLAPWTLLPELIIKNMMTKQKAYIPLPWASVHWLVQCTLECHWNATGWPNVHWDTTGKTLLKQSHTGMPLEKLSWIHPTLGCHWRNSNFCSLHWNTTGGSVTAHTRPDTYC